MRDKSYYTHQSVGVLLYSDDWWARVQCDQGIVSFYSWLCRRNGIQIKQNWKFGPHISFLKGEPPVHTSLWGIDIGPIEFHYSNQIRMDNDFHAWLDVWSDQLIELRATLGLPPKLKMSYHLTLGRLD